MCGFNISGTKSVKRDGAMSDPTALTSQALAAIGKAQTEEELERSLRSEGLLQDP